MESSNPRKALPLLSSDAGSGFSQIPKLRTAGRSHARRNLRDPVQAEAARLYRRGRWPRSPGILAMPETGALDWRARANDWITRARSRSKGSVFSVPRIEVGGVRVDYLLRERLEFLERTVEGRIAPTAARDEQRARAGGAASVRGFDCANWSKLCAM